MNLRSILCTGFFSLCLSSMGLGNPMSTSTASGGETSTNTYFQSCMNSETKLYLTNCLADYRGSPIFRQRCKLLSEMNVDALESRCNAMLERSQPDTKPAH